MALRWARAVVVAGGALVALAATPVPGGAQAPPPTRPPITAPPPTRPPGTTLPPPTSAPPTSVPPGTQPSGTQPPGTQPRPVPSTPTLPLPPTTTPGRTSSDGDGGGFDPVQVLVPLGILAAIVAVGVLALRNRGATDPTPVTATPLPGPAPAATSVAPPGPSPMTHELLEVSRQLTAAATRGEVGRAIVRGALSLVPADAAVLVAAGGGAEGLTVEAESRPDTLVGERLAEGLVGRVAETGESIAQVSATEPAVRNLPAAMIALPLVGGGRVQSVLVLLRSADLPFGDHEVKVLRALVPMAAAARGTERAAQDALEESRRDALTGAHNRRQFDRDLDAALAAPAAGGPVSLAIVDLDHFKQVNDAHGHPAGDALLKAVVQRIRLALRPGDGLYRFGGEEFCLLLAGTDAAEALDVAERVRSAVADAPFDIGAAEPLAKTASLGVVTVAPGTDAATALSRADAALYRSKEEGRNRVTSG